jgi:hypothetical protein
LDFRHGRRDRLAAARTSLGIRVVIIVTVVAIATEHHIIGDEVEIVEHAVASVEFETVLSMLWSSSKAHRRLIA